MLPGNDGEVALECSASSRGGKNRNSATEFACKIDHEIRTGLALFHELLEALQVPDAECNRLSVQVLHFGGIRTGAKIAIGDNDQLDLFHFPPSCGNQVRHTEAGTGLLQLIPKVGLQAGGQEPVETLRQPQDMLLVQYTDFVPQRKIAKNERENSGTVPRSLSGLTQNWREGKPSR